MTHSLSVFHCQSCTVLYKAVVLNWWVVTQKCVTGLILAGLDRKDDPVTRNQSERLWGQFVDLDQLGQCDPIHVLLCLEFIYLFFFFLQIVMVVLSSSVRMHG